MNSVIKEFSVQGICTYSTMANQRANERMSGMTQDQQPLHPSEYVIVFAGDARPAGMGKSVAALGRPGGLVVGSSEKRMDLLYWSALN